MIRDWFGKIPTLVTGGVAIPGVTFGLYMSPMMLSVGYLVGPLFLTVWFIGALIGDIGIVFGGTELGFWDLTTASGIKSSLGMGVMVGTGIGILVKAFFPRPRLFSALCFQKNECPKGSSICVGLPLLW